MAFKNFRISEKLSSLPTLPLGQLTELQGELKELSTVNYQKLKRSIEDKGFIVPVFVWQEPETAVNYICDGHQRSRCLIKEKVSLDTPIPVVFIEAKGILEAKEALLVISSQYGLITQEGLDTFAFDLDEAYLQEMVNFDALKVWEEDIAGLIEGESSDDIKDSEPQIDRAEELNKVWKVRTGDLWQIGEHRLLCGDSTRREDVSGLMGCDFIDCVFTSPPYNANTVIGFPKPNDPNSLQHKPFYTNTEVDNKSDGEYVEFNRMIFSSIKDFSTPRTVVMYNINYNKNSPSLYIDVVNEARRFFRLVETVVWEKQMAISLAGDNLTRIFEFIFVFFNGEGKPKINKSHTHESINNLWKISNIGANQEDHKACFPVGLALKGIGLYSQEKSIIYDPFVGSGTSLVACQNINRLGRGMEISPDYCAVILERMKDTFPELTIERILS